MLEVKFIKVLSKDDSSFDAAYPWGLGMGWNGWGRTVLLF